MKSRWSDSEAKEFVERYKTLGVGEDLAIRTYTTRLLGGDPKLVLHGGGNTSVKTTAKDQLGEDVDVLCVKGSGWDMGNIEPQGLPAVRLHELRRLRRLNTLSDEDMVNFQRINLLDSTAPNPSVETLLHAFLPHKFIDHTHSTAVLALTDQPDGEAIARDIYGKRVAYVPYFIPGFTLAKAVADVFDANPNVEGLILPKHGIFTFSDDAKTAYEKMIEFVTQAAEARRTARAHRARRRHRAHPARRRRHRAQPDGRHGQAPDPVLPPQPGDHGIRERRGPQALQPGRRGDARSHDPHQELAAGRARARRAQAG